MTSKIGTKESSIAEPSFADEIAARLALPTAGIVNALALLDEGATIPFIARYRKESTGALDEVALAAIRDLNQSFLELAKRRFSILTSLDERELLSGELKSKIENAMSLSELEDIYLPFRPRKTTRATQAREKGLEPLAEAILKKRCQNPTMEAARYISPEKGVDDSAAALQGARDIIAEWINEDGHLRKKMRRLFRERAHIASILVKGKEIEGAKFKDYFSWQELAGRVPSHRLLAMFRGESEKVLRLSIRPEEEEGISLVLSHMFLDKHPSRDEIETAARDAYKRLLAPAMETELRTALKEEADRQAIKVFADNLRELLLAPPLGEKSILALDPGFRTGCKLVALTPQGALLETGVVYLHKTQNTPPRLDSESRRIIDLCRKHDIEIIAIGNGTASRESERFIKSIDFAGAGIKQPMIIIVNESGASIYSASETAREEFPDQDITVRGAVSIGRRAMDPLAELVKIDPKSIGVGQYQHDVNQKALALCLEDTVTSCVNSVGVELNTASKELLSYVSGLNRQLAANIIKHREEKGPFISRSSLKKVARLGPKAFEQCAGFLRIRTSKNPLDRSAVHPERYHVVESMAADLGTSVQELMERPDLRKKVVLTRYVSQETGIGLPTLEDIMNELDKPGRDPREKLEIFQFAEGVESISDLREDMVLPGIVTNVTAFGAFVDIGVHQDGLVHISQLADKFVKEPSEIVRAGQKVEVRVLAVEPERKRISLSMRSK